MGHTSFHLNRRDLLRAGIAGAGALALGPAFLRRAFAAGPVTVGDGPYGPLQPADANGIALPAGFSSREIARGASPVSGSTPPYVWHNATDGQATFATLGPGGGPDGGWILVANSEIPAPGGGGVSGVEFAADGEIERAYRVLAGTTSNCAGGPTPWGMWLSCEEHDEGQVWECDPRGSRTGVARPALGIFKHEAACVDPVRQQVYLTEDQGNGCLYRFTPDEYPDLSSGLLEVALVDGVGGVSWAAVPNPAGGALQPTRNQVAGAARFNGGEGTWYDRDFVYFTTKGDSRVWALNVVTAQLEVLYDPEIVGPDAPLSGVDNITVSPPGDIYVCEDRRDHDICLITPDFEISRFLTLDPEIHSGPPSGPIAGNETVGVVFDPPGTKMYFGAQRSFGVGGNPNLPAGVVYEVSGPFRSPNSSGFSKLRLRARRRISIERFLRHGLPIDLELDGPAGVRAQLRVAVGGRSANAGLATIGKLHTGVAIEGRTTLRVEPTKHARRLLRNRDDLATRLKVTATGVNGYRAVARQRVRVFDRDG